MKKIEVIRICNCILSVYIDLVLPYVTCSDALIYSETVNYKTTLDFRLFFVTKLLFKGLIH